MKVQSSNLRGVLMDQKKAWSFLMGSTKYELFPYLHLVTETDLVSEILCLKRT